MRIVETEALSLHAMMMTSNPYFILMQPNTLEIIQKVWKYRKETQIPLCFTLDAGANVHLLYPQKNKEEVGAFIAAELVSFCEQGQYLFDEVGTGAKKV
jgi:diphosphomevalonate decarboxylase